jgi:uncharacterized protein
MKHHFFLKLNPPRPTFAKDMSPEERAIMQQHVGYWTDLMQQGIAVVFGPVLDPAGVHGIGVVAVDAPEQLRTIIDNDPAHGLNRYEYYPMAAALYKTN